MTSPAPEPPSSLALEVTRESVARRAEAADADADSWLASLSTLGPLAQAALPGIYAWGVTVLPLAWPHGAPVLAKLSAFAGIASLVAAPFVERRSPTIGRVLSVWGFTVASAVVWLAVPPATARFETSRAFAGVIGWALFAFASAAPAPARDAGAAARLVASAPLRPRGRIATGDRAILAAGFVVAAAFQAIGWTVAVPERALLLRLLAVVAGLAIIGAATRAALARHAPSGASIRRRVRGAAPPAFALFVLLVVGLLTHLTR